ncbi:sn-glycerol-3-phosphate ABC transporter ATP-binding protein UgpC [Jiella endophytica]|uniref:sn-glycerol-3-phosphate ABC transporter ATP-binding protein UgpC n=1 Tax=Jiella endophytica TaxID=2558362 RepID=A0A4Y8RUA3_9HYPH|nr:sn-glycerol-3-phosphate ABC transporter ATP-binding protein UgpC [Jiella endophytica]TFF27342.1 sn-glycerol-3-phosphate ABC transporter ATP-binding protein UgpC [Jiella endophytica]
MAAIELRNIRKDYGSITVIREISLAIESGEFVVLVGPSGCGKSTLLRMLAGLEEITDGELFIGGRPVGHLPPAERNVAMVFQDYALYPHMSVSENMGFGLKMRDTAQREIDERVANAASILKIEPYLDRRPGQLSGGQRQRVAMGRAIVRDPDAFLFDEPLSNLDAALRVEMRLEIAKLHGRIKATTVYVTHDQVEAMTLADRIVVMNGGNVEQVGQPLELYHSPATLFVAQFIGSPTMNVVECEVVANRPDAVEVALPSGRVAMPFAGKERPQHGVTLGIRPEDLSSTSEGDSWFSGTLSVVERLGGQTFGYLDIGRDKMITVELPRDSRARVGDRLSVASKAANAHLFDTETGRRLDTTPEASSATARVA